MLLRDDRCPQHLLRYPTQFCPLSLGDWIALCERTGLPHLSATRVVDFERDDLLNHEYAGPHQQRLDAAYEAVRGARAPNTMMRWDCCASAKLKWLMSEGRTPRNDDDLQDLPLDTRILEIAWEYPRVLIPAWRRPWIAGDMLFIDGYPVEYRAFVENGRLLGVSSYYPQRPLPRNDRQLQTVEDLVDALLDALSGPFEWPAIKHEALGIRKMATALGKRTPDPDWSWPSSAHRLRLSLLPGLSARGRHPRTGNQRRPSQGARCRPERT